MKEGFELGIKIKLSWKPQFRWWKTHKSIQNIHNIQKKTKIK